jgi:hypothetical protein
MVVHRPFGDEKANPLRTWDVITRIGDTPVDDQGMVRIGPNLRVRFRYLVQHLARGGQVPLTVVRGGKTLALQVPVGPTYPLLVTNLKHGYPPYFILGPLVFTVGSFQLLAAGGRMSSPVTGSPLVTRVMSPPDFPGQELVVVAAPFLPHKVAKGYSSAQLSVLKSVNGVAVKNLRHLVELLRDARDEFLVFDFDRRGGEKLVFARKELEGATEELLVDNGIRSQASPELLEVWRARR